MSNINETNVPISQLEPGAILSRLTTAYDELSPELKKAAGYVIDNPNDVGVSSIREISDAASVTPNTFVRLAKSIGFEGYEDLRSPFREQLRSGSINFTDRARWLQSLSHEGHLGPLYADMVKAAIDNIEQTFGNISVEALTQAGDDIWNSRQVFTLGVGVHNANASNFTYLARTGMVQFQTIPSAGGTAIDELAWADEQDVLIAINCAPFREEVVTAVKVAREQGSLLSQYLIAPRRPSCALLITPSLSLTKHRNSSHRLS